MYEIINSDNVKILSPYVKNNEIEKMYANRSLLIKTDNGILIFFRLFNIKNAEKSENHIYILCTKEKVVFLTNSNFAIKKIKEIAKEKTSSEILYEFFCEITASDLYGLEEFENVISSIESSLLTSKRVDANKLHVIMKYKNKLLRIKRYYEQLLMIADLILENSNFFEEENYIKEHFKALAKRLEKLLNSTMNLREYLTQVREAYQSQIDIEQNDIMRIFTVITTIFLPLTLIVGWYGMNLKMPEFSWGFGYPFVIILSLVVCLICFIVFKIKKWF